MTQFVTDTNFMGLLWGRDLCAVIGGGAKSLSMDRYVGGVDEWVAGSHQRKTVGELQSVSSLHHDWHKRRREEKIAFVEGGCPFWLTRLERQLGLFLAHLAALWSQVTFVCGTYSRSIDPE